MVIPFVSTALLTLAALARAYDTHQGSCEWDGPWVAPVPVGDGWASTPGYQHFCEGGYADGDVLTGIKIWRAEYQIHAISLKWGSHDYGRVYGQAEDVNKPDGVSEWDASAKVLIRMWNNKPDDGDRIDAVGRIRIEVEGKDAVEVSASKKGKVGDEIKFPGGSGKILAAAGAQGAWISTLQFHYLESSVVETVMTSIHFADSVEKYNLEKKGLAKTVVGDLYITNSNPKGGRNITFNLTPKIEKQTSKTITTSMTHSIGTTLGMKISSTVGVAGVASSSLEFSAEIRYDFTYMKSESTTETDIFSFPWLVGSTTQGIPPQVAAHCSAVAIQGTFDSAYTAKITAKLDNGKTFTYNDAGQYKSVGFARGSSECEEIPLADVPSDGISEEANGEAPDGDRSVKRATHFRSVHHRSAHHRSLGL